MPKIKVEDINFYFRVFRNNCEYRQLNEEETVAKYFQNENGCTEATDIPLTNIDHFKIIYPADFSGTAELLVNKLVRCARRSWPPPTKP